MKHTYSIHNVLKPPGHPVSCQVLFNNAMLHILRLVLHRKQQQLGHARPQMAVQYTPQQQLPVLDVSFSTTLMPLLIGKPVLQSKCCNAV